MQLATLIVSVTTLILIIVTNVRSAIVTARVLKDVEARRAETDRLFPPPPPPHAQDCAFVRGMCTGVHAACDCGRLGATYQSAPSPAPRLRKV